MVSTHFNQANPKSSSTQLTKTRPDNTTAYTAGDVINESASVGTTWNFANVVKASNKSGIIKQVTLAHSSYEATLPVLELWLFHTDPTADNDNAAFTPTDAELGDLVGVVPLVTPYQGSTNAVFISQPDLQFTCASADSDLYGVLVVRNAYTPLAEETFEIRLDIEQLD